jgi:hypothetical protein
MAQGREPSQTVVSRGSWQVASTSALCKYRVTTSSTSILTRPPPGRGPAQHRCPPPGRGPAQTSMPDVRRPSSAAPDASSRHRCGSRVSPSPPVIGGADPPRVGPSPAAPGASSRRRRGSAPHDPVSGRSRLASTRRHRCDHPNRPPKPW